LNHYNSPHNTNQMKNAYFLATVILLMSFNAIATEKKHHSKSAKKHSGQKQAATTSKQNVVHSASELKAPAKVDMGKKTDPKNIKDDNYHNEQDNFKRPENLPYNPAPLNEPKKKIQGSENVEESSSGASKTTATPSVTFGFDAGYCPNSTPPDNTVAISSGGFIVNAVNCGIEFNHSNGTGIGSYDYSTFFGTSTSSFSDPRVIYDPNADRFIFMIQSGHTSAESALFIAFSKNNSPSTPADWYGWKYMVSGFAPGVWFDYPSIGINQRDFCITGNLFDDGGSSQGNVMLLFDLASSYSGASPVGKNWVNVHDGSGQPGFTIAPATEGQNIASYSGVFYLVSTLSGGGNYVTLYKITGNASGSPTYTSSNISTAAYTQSGTAVQPGGNILANYKAGCRVESAIYLNGYVFFTYSADYNSGGNDYNSIYFNRINVGTNAISQSWSFLSGSNYNYPSLASFGNSATDKAIIVCFLKSDASTFPEIRFKYFDDVMNQLASSQAHAGTNSVNYSFSTPDQRWGDYTGIQRNYNALQPEVWLSGSYGNASELWTTFIAQINGYPGIVQVSEVNINDKDLVVYPNPVNTNLFIKGDISGIHDFPGLYNTEGKQMPIDVTRKGNEMFQINVSTLTNGMYFVRLSDGKTIKFIKQ